MLLSLPKKMLSHVTGSLSEAYKEAVESKDSGFAKKIGLFLWSFTKNMLGISRQRAEATKTTTKEVQAEINKTVKKYRERAGLVGESKEEGDSYNRVLAVALRSFKQLDKDTRAHAEASLNSIRANRKGGDNLDFKQKSSLAAVGILTLSRLRKKYPKKADFKSMLAKLAKTARRSKFPIKRLLNSSLVGVFKLNTEAEALRFVKRLGLKPATPETAQLFIRLSHNSSKDDLAAISKILKKKLFRKTSRKNVRKLVDLVKKMTHSMKGKFNPGDLTDFVFLVDERDYGKLISFFTGGRTGKTIKTA